MYTIKIFLVILISIYLMSSPIRTLRGKRRSSITDLAYHLESNISYLLILVSAIAFSLPYFIINSLISVYIIRLVLFTTFILEFITLMLTFQSYYISNNYLKKAIKTCNILHIISCSVMVVLTVLSVL